MSREVNSEVKVELKTIILSALSAGLYPLIYLYKLNHTLLSSWEQFTTLTFVYLIVPLLVFIIVLFLINKIQNFRHYTLQLFVFLNLVTFAGLIIYSSYGFNKKMHLISIGLIFLLSFLLKKYLKLILKFQFLLAFIGVIFSTPLIFKYFNYNSQWKNQKDNIEDVRFKLKPNIYMIQPDGYIGFSEIDKGSYNFDNKEFNVFLHANKFTLYPNFRSNYYSTLSSNSSLFAMKHHYYYNGKSNIDAELIFAREAIVGENSVLSIFKKNNYKTNLIIENGYLLANRPNVFYDYCNVNLSDLSVRASGFETKKDVTKGLELAMTNNSDSNNFYFIERIIPGHIATFKSSSKGKVEERINYINKVKKSNEWLKEVIDVIEEKDPNSIIIIAADHGGFVGYDYSSQSSKKPESRDDTFSMFSALLAIKWPNDASQYDMELNTSVNLFRVLFAYLSEDKLLLNNLEKDRSYLPVVKNATTGIYEVIDENSNAVFNKL